MDIFKTVSRVLKNKKLIIAGVDNPSISGTLRESEKYAELGADLIRIRIPRRRNTIDNYFEEVLKNISKPVLIIHQMSPGGFDSSMTTEGADPDQIGRFCDHDNVFGYIASHLVRFEMMTRKFVDQSKQFWVPNAMLMPTMSLEGANGGCFMSDELVFEVPEKVKAETLVDEAKYHEMYAESLRDPDTFWGEHGQRVDWMRPYTKVKDTLYSKENVFELVM